MFGADACYVGPMPSKKLKVIVEKLNADHGISFEEADRVVNAIKQKLEADNARLSGEGRQLRTELTAQKESTATCEARSAKLYQYGDELLGLYVNKGTITGALQGEPFTGIKRIEVENVTEDYRDKLDQVKPQPAAKGS